jgi:hypothetical protein
MKKQLKNTIGLGVGSLAGMGAMGAIGGMSGMPKEAGNVTSAAGAGLTMLNVANMAKIGMNIMPKGKSSKSKIKDARLRRMLGK